MEIFVLLNNSFGLANFDACVMTLMAKETKRTQELVLLFTEELHILIFMFKALDRLWFYILDM